MMADDDDGDDDGDGEYWHTFYWLIAGNHKSNLKNSARATHLGKTWGAVGPATAWILRIENQPSTGYKFPKLILVIPKNEARLYQLSV